MGGKISNDSSESTQQIQSHTFMRTPKPVKNLCNFKFYIFDNLFSFSLTWDHMGVKISNDISETTHQIHYPKIHVCS